MTRKNVLPAAILVAAALVFSTVLVVPNSIGLEIHVVPTVEMVETGVLGAQAF